MQKSWIDCSFPVYALTLPSLVLATIVSLTPFSSENQPIILIATKIDLIGLVQFLFRSSLHKPTTMPGNGNDSDTDPEDEDYILEPTSDDEGVAQVFVKEDVVVGISEANRGKVDDLWASMNGGGGDAAAPAKKKNKKDGKKVKVSKKEKERKKMLKEMFGSTVAKELAASSRVSGMKKKKTVTSLSSAAPKKVVEKTIRRFAGKDIEVTRTVLQIAKSGSDIDSMLNTLKGPDKLTTIGKTAIDWDNLKESSGLGEDMEKAAEKVRRCEDGLRRFRFYAILTLRDFARRRVTLIKKTSLTESTVESSSWKERSVRKLGLKEIVDLYFQILFMSFYRITDAPILGSSLFLLHHVHRCRVLLRRVLLRIYCCFLFLFLRLLFLPTLFSSLRFVFFLSQFSHCPSRSCPTSEASVCVS